MPLLPSKSIQEQPDIWLERWRVIQADRESRHFVGFSVEDQDGRVSTPIVSFNPAERSGLTASGRRYVLVGPPGFDDDAEYVWECYSGFYEIKEVVDVTDQYAGPGGQLEDE
ncbi:hypothetical protein BJN34_01340 [Cupriavidus necator]|uniref:Uncharacterized protein n=1 Tax=Cupriavidus necator TaxID=106590 RepID=A0A1U9UIW9_CUPNE|nr:hypothetical protein BJN34_01340 [Cupriavidus necator]